MKKGILSIIIMIALAITNSSQAQIGIGVATANINASAQLEVASTTKGFLPPRMTASERDAISTPAAGLVLWCTNCGITGELQLYNGTAWTNSIGGAATAVPVPTLAIGDSYQGGKIAYILQAGDSGYVVGETHGLIAATLDQGSSIPFSGWWHINTTGTELGTGLTNTNTINTSTTYAAGLAKAYDGGGYTDWYLPSKEELNKLFLNKVLIGGFADAFYWSSSVTNSDGTYVYHQNFVNGSSYDTYPDNEENVRAIRSF
jgi:hypothetical protein